MVNMKNIIAFMFMAISGTTLAGGVVDDAIIEKIQIRQSNGYVLIKTDKTPENRSSCATNSSWDYTLPITDEIQKAQMSVLLTAYASKAKVKIDAAFACNEHNEIESLDMITVK